jgi:hypothetical protein
MNSYNNCLPIDNIHLEMRFNVSRNNDLLIIQAYKHGYNLTQLLLVV